MLRSGTGRLLLANSVLTALVFAADLRVPLGVAAGVPYVAPVLLSLWLPGRRATLGFAVAGSVLTALGLVVSPAGGEPWKVLANRGLAGFAIWVTAGLVLQRKRIEGEHREAEAALAREKEFAESLVETARAVVLVLDLEGRIVRFNRYFEELSGYHLDEVRGRSWFGSFLPQRDRDRIRGIFRNAIGGVRTRGNINAIVTRDGGERDIEWYDEELHDASGRRIGLLAVGLDVTERRALQDQLVQAQKMEAVGRLAGGIAHDFNNLLMAMRGSGEILRARLPEDEAARRALERIDRAVERAAALTEKLLAFGRRQVLRPEILDLNERVRQTGDILARLLGSEVKLELHLDPGLWRVEMDPVQLDQILMNLIVNAKDAMPEGGSIRIETENVALDAEAARATGVDPGRYVCLAVADTGCGMDPGTAARIFEPFFTTKEPGRGTGLGLSTLYGIAKQCGGGIRVESELGRGSRFRVCLPRADAAVEAQAAPAARRGGDSGGVIVLVEDDAALRDLMQEVLEADGHRVACARDAREALERAAREPRIDLLITDVTMPGRSGPDLAAELRERDGGLGVIFISGYAKDALREAADAFPDAVFLRKPFGNRLLRRRAREAVEARKSDSASSESRGA